MTRQGQQHPEGTQRKINTVIVKKHNASVFIFTGAIRHDKKETGLKQMNT